MTKIYSLAMGKTTSVNATLQYFFDLAEKLPDSNDIVECKMTLQLNKINPKFRELVDVLLFSERMDLDLSKFKDLLKENYGTHFEYLWDRFCRSLEISWEDGQTFWSSRLAFLLSLNDKGLAKKMEDTLQERMFSLVRSVYDIDTAYNVEYLQFVEFCKIKHQRKEKLTRVKQYLTEMPSHIRFEKLIGIINTFIPIVFSSLDEYAALMINRITISSRNYELLLAFEEKGFSFSRKPVINLVKELVLEREKKLRNCRAFFTLINDPVVRAGVKEVYDERYRSKIIHIFETAEFRTIEEHHLRNIKNVLELDELLADDILTIYADKLYDRGTVHKYANADRLIRLLKDIPQISQRKVLVYLSSNNKMVDIKYVLTAFPELKKLAAFI